MIRRPTALLVSLVLSLLLPYAARAQATDSGQIRIIVTDGASKATVELARVLLDGPVMTSQLTGKNGQVLFTEVPDGIYHARIAKSGYQMATSPAFEVVNGRAINVNVTLALATQMKVIATVSARSTVSVSSSAITNDSAQRKLSNDLADALNKLSGVSVSTNGDDNNATQTVSLEGHDASQTQLTLDGIPLNAPGTAGDLRGLATDLFSGASVRNGPQLGGLGGGVNFSTMQPTISWLSNLSLSTGSNGKYNYSFGESGSIGRLGLALQSTYRLNPSLIDGMRYLDASGLDYVHDGDSSIAGNLAKFRYQFSDTQTLTGTFLNSTRATDLACLRDSGGLPCGYGPGNSSDGNVQLYALTDTALLGETQLQTSLFSNDVATVLDESNRFIGGVAQPIGYSTNVRSSGYSVNATLPARERHTISIQAYGSSATSSTAPFLSQAAPYYQGSSQSSYSAVQVSDNIRSNDMLTLAESIGANAATNAPASLLASVGATWRPTLNDTFTASYALGGVAASPGRSTVLTDPGSLRFDCNGNVAYGNAPGDAPGASSSTSARIGYTRALRGGSMTLQLYRQVQNGTLLPVQVNGSVLESMGVLTPAYLAQVQALYDSSGGCGAAPGTSFAASQLYFSSPVAGVERTYEGGSLTGFLSVGHLVVQPFYNVNVSKVQSGDPRIANGYSVTIPGSQLPNVPLQRGGLVLDYKAPRSSLEWLADAQYTSKNNPNNLPAYTTFDAGVSARLQTGTLTVAANNITNVYSGIFASPQNAVPYQTLNGTLIPTVARPLAPRSYSVTYSLKFGPGAGGNTQTAAAFRAPRGAAASPDQESRGSAFRSLLTPLPTTPPAHPLDVNSSGPLCTAEAAPVAQKLAGQLSAYVAEIEAAKAASGYPAAMSALALDNATVVYHGMGLTYALAITPKFVQPSPSPSAGGARGNANGALRSLFGCLPVHLAQQDDVKNRNLYVPASGVFFAPQIAFMPSTGLYVVARPQTANRETFRVYALPSSPPADPFVIRATADTCTADLRATASQAIDQLRAYFKNGAKSSLWTISPHDAKSGTWYGLSPADPATLGAILMCGRVGAASPDDIKSRGFDGDAPPSLNYAKPLGLYLVRPQRPSRPGANAPAADRSGAPPPGPPAGPPPPGGGGAPPLSP